MDQAVLHWILGGGLLAVMGAIGWQARTVIHTTNRVSKLEAQVAASNVRQEVGAVHKRVDEMAKTVAENSGQLKQINNTLGLIQAHLMGGAS